MFISLYHEQATPQGPVHVGPPRLYCNNAAANRVAERAVAQKWVPGSVLPTVCSVLSFSSSRLHGLLEYTLENEHMLCPWIHHVRWLHCRGQTGGNALHGGWLASDFWTAVRDCCVAVLNGTSHTCNSCTFLWVKRPQLGIYFMYINQYMRFYPQLIYHW
jgi:hypothetical protein